jgi:hypothetical protein
MLGGDLFFLVPLAAAHEGLREHTGGMRGQHSVAQAVKDKLKDAPTPANGKHDNDKDTGGPGSVAPKGTECCHGEASANANNATGQTEGKVNHPGRLLVCTMDGFPAHEMANKVKGEIQKDHDADSEGSTVGSVRNKVIADIEKDSKGTSNGQNDGHQ